LSRLRSLTNGNSALNELCQFLNILEIHQLRMDSSHGMRARSQSLKPRVGKNSVSLSLEKERSATVPAPPRPAGSASDCIYSGFSDFEAACLPGCPVSTEGSANRSFILLTAAGQFRSFTGFSPSFCAETHGTKK
jgi:hypothetical protein